MRPRMARRETMTRSTLASQMGTLAVATMVTASGCSGGDSSANGAKADKRQVNVAADNVVHRRARATIRHV